MACETWEVWGTEASVVVTEPAALAAASAVVRQVLQSVDEACSRFRSDSELMRLRAPLARGTEVSQMLALLVRQAVRAANWTGGDVDPTLGNNLLALGYDRDLRSIDPFARRSAAEPAAAGAEPHLPGWKRLRLDGTWLQVPADLLLDLGATAKAVAADLAAAKVFEALGCGVLVSLGGDLASAGPCPDGGWQVLVQDTGADPAQQVSLAPGCAMATSSTRKRRWQYAGREMHHILDPRFGQPAEAVWRSATVASGSCLRANAFSTAAIVRGYAAVGWLESRKLAARLVDRNGNVVVTGGWPQPAYQPAGEAAHE